MPWKNTTPMEEINRFVILAQSDRFTVTELCEQFDISRKTGYKHLERYAAEGIKGLQARSHRPHQFPQRTDEIVEALILAERRLHRTWGPKKLHNGQRQSNVPLDDSYFSPRFASLKILPASMSYTGDDSALLVTFFVRQSGATVIS